VKRNWLEAVATAQIEGELLQISLRGVERAFLDLPAA
jgi:hypothetical protein